MASAADHDEYSRRERWLVVGFALLGTLFDGLDFAIFTYYLVPLSKYFHVSLVAMTTIQSASYLTGILGGALFGLLADRRGRRYALAATIALYSLGSLASAFSPNYGVLFILRSIAGLGIGGESGVAFAYLNEAWRTTRRRGLLNGFMQSMFIVGGFFAAQLFKSTLPFGADAWRYSFGFIGLVAILAVGVRLFMPESKLWERARREPKAVREGAIGPLKEMFTGSLLATSVIALLVSTFGFWTAYATVTFGPSLWQQVYKVPPTTVANIGLIASAVTFVSYNFAGWLSDVIGRGNAFRIAAAIGAAGYIVFGILTLGLHVTISPAVAIGSVIFYSYLWLEFGYGTSAVQQSWFAELFPTRVRATAMNVTYYVGRAIGAGIFPLAAIAIATNMGLGIPLAMSLGTVGAVGALLLSFMLRETRGTDIASIGESSAPVSSTVTLPSSLQGADGATG